MLNVSNTDDNCLQYTFNEKQFFFSSSIPEKNSLSEKQSPRKRGVFLLALQDLLRSYEIISDHFNLTLHNLCYVHT